MAISNSSVMHSWMVASAERVILEVSFDKLRKCQAIKVERD